LVLSAYPTHPPTQPLTLSHPIPSQVILDAAAAEKVSWGSYHAITDMIPSLAVRYPYMCYGFLANLSLHKVGELEVPVGVIKGLDG
jgi:hypothetical protein